MGPNFYSPWSESYELIDPREFGGVRRPPAPQQQDEGHGRMAEWIYGRTRRPMREVFWRNPESSWEETLANARNFTPSSASDFPETGSRLVDDRNWAWQNFFSNIGNSALGQSAGVQALGPGRQEDAMLMLDLQAENERINAERNRMRREDVGRNRYAWDLATPAVSLGVGIGLPVGGIAKTFGGLASLGGRAFPNVFRNTGPSFVNAYFPQAQGVMRYLQAAGERLPTILGANQVSSSDPGQGFRTALPWIGGGLGYGAGTMIGRRILARGLPFGWGSGGAVGIIQKNTLPASAFKHVDDVPSGIVGGHNLRTYEGANDFYNSYLNRMGTNMIWSGGGSGLGSMGGAVGSGLLSIAEEERLLRELEGAN